MNYLGCTDECRSERSPCKKETCRYWIKFENDLNCSLISAEEHGPMTLEEVSQRLNLTVVRVKQIQDEAFNKMKKRILPILHE